MMVVKESILVDEVFADIDLKIVSTLVISVSFSVIKVI